MPGTRTLVSPSALSLCCMSSRAAASNFGGAGSVISERALLISTPVSWPLLSFWMMPPSGDTVLSVIFHLARAALLSMAVRPPRCSTSGLFGATASSSARVGRRTSFSCASCQSALLCSSSPGAWLATPPRIAASTSSILRVRDRSIPGPPPAPCRCPSLRPGIMVRPPMSTTRVTGPTCLLNSVDDPITRNFPSLTANPCATVLAASTVRTLALV